MRTAFICPFALDRLTGTPIRSRSTISSVGNFSKTTVIAVSGSCSYGGVRTVGTGGLSHFSLHAIKELRLIRPGIIHGFTTISVIPMFLYKIFCDWKVKIIFEMHGWAWFETCGKLSLHKRVVFLILDYFGLVFADAIIAMSYSAQNFLRRLTKNRKIHVIWGPADFGNCFQDIPRRESVVAGYIGNNNQWQGLCYVIGAARLLEKTNPEIIFELGGFDYTDDILFPKISTIKYHGRIEREDVPKFIRNCDVMLSPRVKSGVSDMQFPQKLSEYLACGRGVIVSDTSDQGKIINEAHCGLICEQLTDRALADVIKQFASATQFERNLLGKKALNYAKENMSTLTYRDSLWDVYREFIYE